MSPHWFEDLLLIVAARWILLVFAGGSVCRLWRFSSATPGAGDRAGRKLGLMLGTWSVVVYLGYRRARTVQALRARQGAVGAKRVTASLLRGRALLRWVRWRARRTPRGRPAFRWSSLLWDWYSASRPARSCFLLFTATERAWQPAAARRLISAPALTCRRQLRTFELPLALLLGEAVPEDADWHRDHEKDDDGNHAPTSRASW